jgi:tetratricopeptide (TPR) repeat protein
MYKTKLVLLCLLSLWCFGCYADAAKKDGVNQGYDDFQNHYLRAMATNDEEVILDEIKYMDSVIGIEGDKKIKSIYYNKAQLLYKLKKYDEAVATLYQTDDERYDVVKAALLILLGNDTGAQKLLAKQIEKNKTILYQFLEEPNQRDNLILGTISLYVLSAMSMDSFFSELVNNDIVTQEHLNDLITQMPQKDVLLNSMWPN